MQTTQQRDQVWKDLGGAWWDLLEEIGPHYGYFPNGSKTYIVAKPEVTETAKEVFQGTGISISTEGRSYLGGAIGTTSFQNQLIDRKVREWAEEIRTLSEIARTEPHAAFAAFIHTAFPPDGTTSYGSWI